MYLILLIGSIIISASSTYILTSKWLNRTKNIGDLVVVSDEDGTYFSMSLYDDYTEYIADDNYVTLKVKIVSR